MGCKGVFVTRTCFRDVLERMSFYGAVRIKTNNAHTCMAVASIGLKKQPSHPHNLIGVVVVRFLNIEGPKISDDRDYDQT